MNPSSSRRKLLLAGGLLLAAALAPAVPAHAQLSKNAAINTDPRVNGRHLRDAVVLGEAALARLQGPNAVQEIPTAHKSIDLMYRTVRLALFGLREKKRLTKYEDPMLEYELGKTGQAWDLIRGPVDRYFDGLPPEVYIQRSVKDLEQALAILRPVAAVME